MTGYSLDRRRFVTTGLAGFIASTLPIRSSAEEAKLETNEATSEVTSKDGTPIAISRSGEGPALIRQVEGTFHQAGHIPHAPPVYRYDVGMFLVD